MKSKEREIIKVSVMAEAPVDEVWKLWTCPDHISRWYFASDDWHAPLVKNDLIEGGRFKIRMEARDGSEGFDFKGTYTSIVTFMHIAYTIIDGRKVVTEFRSVNGSTVVTQRFEAEDINPTELQREGWQAILNNFAIYVRKNKTAFRA
jgi:uncharacterized protein YndB with AHSA1/START domain